MSKKIAILGVTGYIGKSLLREFFRDKGDVSLYLFSRSGERIKELCKQYDTSVPFKLCSFEEFNTYAYDVVINATGVGSPNELKNNPASVFSITEEIDTLVLSYLEAHKKTLYINLSSGAVYGKSFDAPINKSTQSVLSSSASTPSDFYAIAKIHAEARHRALPHLRIVDLRIFAFFSSFVDPHAGFLMSEIVECLQTKKVFVTNSLDIVRDYSVPSDLYALIMAVIESGGGNDFFDVYSKRHVSKFELLSFLHTHYGLDYVIKDQKSKKKNETKNIYYSTNKKAKLLGYTPEFTSLKGIAHELNQITKK